MAFNIKRHKDPAKSADKYKRKTAAAGPDWLEGYQNPKKDPQKAAAASELKWENNLKAAMTAKRFSKNVLAYNPNEAIANAEAIGLDNYTRGTGQRIAKVQRKMVLLAAAQTKIDAVLDTMPNGTPAEREARALYQMREMAKVRGTIN